MRRMPGEDLYIVLANFDLASQTASLQIVINPLVNWIWFGFGVLAFGTGITLLPERTYSFALAKLPADAATTVGVLLLAFVLGGTTLAAQHTETSSIAPVLPRNDVEKRLGQRLVCLCGSCGKEPIGVCACDYAKGVRREIAALVDQGKTEDQILQHFIDEYGSQELLGAPLDQGFNRMAWLFPYLAGAGGVIAIGFAAVRWSRRAEPAGADTLAPADEELTERLDDELRNLD
jgi:cytochrome c-type biogenesis protein CcmH/NrfF